MNIKDIFKLKTTKGEVGLEIELEGIRLPRHFDNWWVVEDHSLKDGPESCEYVLCSPKDLPELEMELFNFQQGFTDSIVKNSIYAGTHTHINVQQLTPKQVINHVCAYLIVEDLLVHWCGPSRVGNHFCLRTRDATWIIEFIRSMIIEDNFYCCKDNDQIRYSSINLKSIPKYGSIEFRSLNSTIDISRIMTWARTLVNIKNESLKFPSPDAMIRSIGRDSEMFVKTLLGQDYHVFLTNNWQNSVRDGIRRAQDIAFCKDWNKMNMNIFKNAQGVF